MNSREQTYCVLGFGVCYAIYVPDITLFSSVKAVGLFALGMATGNLICYLIRKIIKNRS